MITLWCHLGFCDDDDDDDQKQELDEELIGVACLNLGVGPASSGQTQPSREMYQVLPSSARLIECNSLW